MNVSAANTCIASPVYQNAGASTGKFFTRLARKISNFSVKFPVGGSPEKMPADIAPAQISPPQQIEQRSSWAQALIVHSIRDRSPLPTLADLKQHLEGLGADWTFDHIQELIYERICHRDEATAVNAASRKRNYLRVLITDLDLCAKTENDNTAQRNLARETLDKEICGHPFKSYGNLNENQHGALFLTAESQHIFKSQMMATLEELQSAWKRCNEQEVDATSGSE